MNKIIPTAAALALAFSLPGAALAQNQGHGRGNGHDSDHARQDRGDDDEKRGGQDRADRGGGDDDDDDRGRGQDRAEREVRSARQVLREAARGRDENRGRERDDDRGERLERDVRRAVVAGSPLTMFRIEPDRGLVAGCPPGLARRNNGCLPPGLARKVERARYDWLWASRNDDARYRYDDGYLYRLDDAGSVLGWLPALGGALAPGAVWPAQYAYQSVPSYFSDYFRLDDPYDYRYANGALYGVDPRTQAITQVVALLTGQPITVGQPMPAGYDVYNVPYPYRARYVDTADSLYRYNDGYVYQVDPTTQLVQAAIQLLT